MSESIRFDEPLHRAGETLDVNAAATQAAAWWVASELVRRHPNKLMVIEDHPGGGTYDCLSVYRRKRSSDSVVDEPGELVVHMNLAGDAHLTHGRWFKPQEADTAGERFNWAEVILSTDRRRYVLEQLEGVEGLEIPRRARATECRSIGLRAISGFMGRAAFGRGSDRLVREREELPWVMVNGWSESESYSYYRTELFETFSGIGFEPPSDALLSQGDLPVYDYWFLVDGDGGAAVAVDVSRGHAWTARGEFFDLMAGFAASGRRIDPIVNALFPLLQ